MYKRRLSEITERRYDGTREVCVYSAVCRPTRYLNTFTTGLARRLYNEITGDLGLPLCKSSLQIPVGARA